MQTRDQLRDSLMDQMDLDGYGQLLLETHGVLKTATLIDIRTELLAPFEDSRLLPGEPGADRLRFGGVVSWHAST